MPPSSSRISIPWHALLVAGLTLGLLWWFFRNLDFQRGLAPRLSRRILALIVTAVLVTLVTYVLRAWRWQALLRPARPRAVSQRPFARRHRIHGDVPAARRGSARCCGRTCSRARRTFNPASDVRHGDRRAAARLGQRAAAVRLALPLTAAMDVGREVELAGAVGAVLAIAAVGAPRRVRRASGAAGTLGRALTRQSAVSGCRRPPTHFVRTFAEGLSVMRGPAPLWPWRWSWSVPLWLSIALGDLADLPGVRFDVFLRRVVPCGGVSGRGRLVADPGRRRRVSLVSARGDAAFSGPSSRRKRPRPSCSTLVSFVPVTILGLIFMWQDGLTLGGLRQMKSTAEAAK